jgi:tRNA nucleotidyltransferase/poly(A) polymerase
VKSIERSCQDIVKVSSERVRDELLKILASASAHNGLRLLSDLWILDYVLPEIADLIGTHHGNDKGTDSFDQTVSRFEYLTGMNALLSSRTIAEESYCDVILENLSEIVPDLEEYFERKVDGGINGWTVLRLGALFFDIGLSMELEDEPSQQNVVWADRQLPVDLVVNRMQALRMSKEAIKHVRSVIAHRRLMLKLATKEALSKRDVYRFFLSTGSAGIDIAWLTIADQLTRNNGDLSRDSGTRLISTVRILLENYFLRYKISIKPTPLADGSVLISQLDIDPGPEIGRLLAIIEEAQAVGEVTTLDEAIHLAQSHQAVN